MSIFVSQSVLLQTFIGVLGNLLYSIPLELFFYGCVRSVRCAGDFASMS
jgi:hypothetical protein